MNIQTDIRKYEYEYEYSSHTDKHGQSYIVLYHIFIYKLPQNKGLNLGHGLGYPQQEISCFLNCQPPSYSAHIAQHIVLPFHTLD